MKKFPKFTNISNDFTSKGIFNIQNNFYKEDINIINNPKMKNDIKNKKLKGNSNSKNKYKVTYKNSILNNNNMNENKDFFQNLGNKNVLIINNKINNSNGNIKQINYYNNKNNNNNITGHNFYNKKLNEILSESNNNISTNNKNSNNTNSNTESNNYNNKKNSTNKSHSIIHNNSHNNINNKNHMNINTNKSIKKSSSKNKNIKIIYSNKRPSMPIGNKNKNKIKNKTIHNRNKSKKIDEKDNTSKSKLSKISMIKNRNKITNNGGLLNSNYYSNTTYTNENNLNSHKNNLVPMNLKYNISSNKKNKNKKPFQEIKKSQSQSYFGLNHDLNTSNYKSQTNNNLSKSKSKSKTKNRSKNDKSYKGIIMDKKNMLKNNLIKSSSHNSTSKKNPFVSNNKNKYINNSNTKNSNNKININNNNNHFMNNLPEEYNKNPLFLEIKNLWNKLRVSYSYQEMFVTLTNQLDDKKAIFTHEKKSLTLIINHLNKLNTNIKTRNSIIDKLKQISSNNNDEIVKLLISLRKITIDVVNDYILFIKEISYDVLRNKFNLENIKNFDKNYINILKNDTKFLFSHNYLNKIFYFSDKSDPFLKYPSSSQANNNDNKYMLLPLDDETLQKINECQYLLITEKIYDYSMCNNKTRVNYLLFSEEDNIINKHIIKNENYPNNEAKNYSINQNDGDISPFTTPNNKSKNAKINMNTTNNTNINNMNNSNTNENKKTEEINKKSEDDNISNNEKLINKISSSNNNVETNENNISKNESNKNNSIINNSDDLISSPIKGNLKINEDNDIDIPNENNEEDDIKIAPYIPLKDESLSSLYSSYLTSVSENVKQSFNINEDIFYYSNIGIYPKIILFKDNKNSNIKGICTISFNQTINTTISLNKRILTVTSISCSKEYQISNILLKLIEFCKNEEMVYDSIEVNLYYIKKEDGKFVLDESLENEIKSKAKFKWVRLENDGEKRKIKYHYIPNNIIIDKEGSIFNNYNMNNLDMNCNKCAIYLNNYVLIKYYEENGINDISMVEYSKLFFVINSLKKYFLLNDTNTNIEQNIQNILTNLKGLKLKKIVRILSEFNNVLLTHASNFKDDYLNNDYDNIDLLNNFLKILSNETDEKNISLNFNNICTNFSNIIKIELDGYEYNIISMNDFIIEVFSISTDNDKEVIYFTKSEIENISFIFYEQNDDNQNGNDENYIKLLFNKVLKKILLKDSEEPIKSYKKLCIPSFSYQKKVNEENGEDDKLNIIKCDILDCNESFDFCIENIRNYSTKFSFPFDIKNIVESNEIKIIKNNFVIAILNPDLVLDYHLPSMNIYYINRENWIEAQKE